MEKRRDKKIFAIIGLFVVLAGISIGFAAMSTTLQIQGTAEMVPATWKIKFANLSAPTLDGGATVLTPPTINTNDTVISTFDVRLIKPGSKVVYTFDVVNSGSINAQLGTFNMPTPSCAGTGGSASADATLVCSNLVYTLKYTIGAANVQTSDTLTAGQTRNMTLTIEYPLAMTQLPANNVEITNLGLALIYNQA